MRVTTPAIVLLALTTGVFGQTTSPSTQPAWDPQWFKYVRPSKVAVEETTPTANQLNFILRPTQADVDAAPPKATPPAEPGRMGEFDVVHLRLNDAEGGVIPALLCKPRGKKGPFPVVIATHGYTSNKAQVCAQVGMTLTERGFAVLAADMPCHGERPGEPRQIMDRTHPLQAYKLYRQAVIDVLQLIDVAQQRPDLDTSRGVTLVGYSMGSWISSVAGPADDRVKAMVLMVGGATDIPPGLLQLPAVAATDPRVAIRHFAPRPILMLNGRSDVVVTAAMTSLLWDAAPLPKEQLWYDSGHLLPKEAYSDAAEWVAKQYATLKKH
jgi:dienelactone hydrolase